MGLSILADVNAKNGAETRQRSRALCGEAEQVHCTLGPQWSQHEAATDDCCCTFSLPGVGCVQGQAWWFKETVEGLTYSASSMNNSTQLSTQ